MLAEDKEAQDRAEEEAVQTINDQMESLILSEVYFEKELVDNDEELHEIETKQKTLTLQAQRFVETPEWKAFLENIHSFRVMKMPHIIQSLLFLVGVEREQVCEPGTNKLSWKKAKALLVEELPAMMAKYEIWGEKKGTYKPYQTINFCEKIISALNPEDVDAYNLGLGKLYRWNKMAIEGRKQDITRRKILQKKGKEERELKEQQFEERKKNRETHLAESLQKFNEDHADEIDAYNKYQDELKAKAAQEYGEEAASEGEGDGNEAEPPELPKFDEEAAAE